MLNPEEEQFEARLKQFRPLDAEPSSLVHAATARRRRFVLAACAAAAIAIVMVVLLKISHQRDLATAPQHTLKQAVEAPANSRPLTIGSANELLAGAPSVKSALDELAFDGRPKQLPPGKQSALAVLGKEDFKL